MTNDEEMAARGRMATDYGEKKRHLITLQNEAQRIGEKLVELGDQLRFTPGKFQCNEHAHPFLNTKLLTELARDYERTEKEVAQLKTRLKALGLIVEDRASDTDVI